MRRKLTKPEYDKFAEYEDLDRQGRLIKLPCNIGDTVYSIHKVASGRHAIFEVKADAFFITLSVIEGRFGKTVFLNRQEAVVKVIERNGERDNL